MKTAFLISLFLLSPLFASADIAISEVAWMGSDNGGTARQNANDEWIELFNNGAEPVDLTGWSLIAEDGKPSIDLSGTVLPSGFFLLERSDDNSAPGVPADMFYSSALENGGEVLVLKDGKGVEIQRIDALDGWPAGDNESKETMQWNGTSWITATPTPKALNAGVSPIAEEESVSDQTEQEGDNETIEQPAAKGPAVSKKDEEGVAKEVVSGEDAPRITITLAETEPENAEREPWAREPKKENKAEVETTAKKKISEERADKGGRRNEISNNGTVAQNPAAKKEIKKVNPLSDSEMVQTASVASSISDTVRGANEWLTLVLLLGILAGIGSLFIRG